MKDYLVVMQVTYEDQVKTLTSVVEAGDEESAKKYGLALQEGVCDDESLTPELGANQGPFTYDVMGVTQLQSVPLMIDGRSVDLLMTSNNAQLKKISPIKKSKTLTPYSVGVKWVAEGCVRQLNSVLMATNKKDAVVKTLLSLCLKTDEWDVLDQLEAADGYDITAGGSRYIASSAIPMEFIDVAVANGCVTALVPMRTNEPGDPIIATLTLPNALYIYITKKP